MPKAKLVINGEKEVGIERNVISVGRVPENTVSLDDSNVSRYHIEIEKRAGDEYWVIELGSSNGTTVNGITLYSEKLLKDGDIILLGGSSEILFEFEKDESKEANEENSAQSAEQTAVSTSAGVMPDVGTDSAVPEVTAPEGEIAVDEQKSSGFPIMLGVLGVVCGLAVVFAMVAIAISFSSGGSSGSSGSSNCEAKAKIISPESGDLIGKETEVEVDAENSDCVKRAVFLMDGKEFASAEDAPYSIKLDPKNFGEYSDGFNHSLQIAFEDDEGKKVVQPGEVLISFETLATPTPTPEEEETPEPDATPTPKKGEDEKTVSPKDTLALSQNLLSDFPGSPAYKFDPQFLQEVQKKTGEYAAAEGFYARAQNYRDTINVPFQEMGLGVQIGYLLAMSRSQFKLPNQGAEQGLWRMSDDIVSAKGYNGSCGTETLNDPQQKCAARAAALYLKDLGAYFTNGEGGIVYMVAAFGMTPENAITWKSSLPPPPQRADFWKVINSPKQRDEVVKFFAAGIVAKNPQKFGLKKDLPISEIYKNFIVNK